MSKAVIPGLRAGRRSIQVHVLRATVYGDNRMGVDPMEGSDEASAAGTFRAGSSDIPAVIPVARERSPDRTLLSFGTGLLHMSRNWANRSRELSRATRPRLAGPGGENVVGEPPARSSCWGFCHATVRGRYSPFPLGKGRGSCGDPQGARSAQRKGPPQRG